METGDYANAERQFREILRLDPINAKAIEQLSRLLRGQRLITLEETAAKALRKAPSGSMDAVDLNFALSRVHDAADNRTAAADARQKANGSLAKQLPYDAETDTEDTARILRKFASVSPMPAMGRHDPYPIYVLGLPRSGTSLVEAMLSRLPNVAPLGERAATGFLLREHLDTDRPFDAQHARYFAEEDAAMRPTLPQDTVGYVDKMPENYRYIGFIKTAYPQSKIIHVRRDPRDTALSMWKSHFTGRALSYTYDQDAMAHRFGLHARMMAHWNRIFPGQILTVEYEDLATDPIGSSQTIASFCDLAWNPEMASPEGSDAPTLTASAAQIRQPVHNRSIGQWQTHKDELATFLTALDTSLWPNLTE